MGHNLIPQGNIVGASSSSGTGSGGPLITSNGFGAPIREVTAAGAVTTTVQDFTVVINKTVAATTAVTLVTPTYNQIVTIKDGKGDAATNNITITPASGLIDLSANAVINTNRGAYMMQFNTASGNWWII